MSFLARYCGRNPTLQYGALRDLLREKFFGRASYIIGEGCRPTRFKVKHHSDDLHRSMDVAAKAQQLMLEGKGGPTDFDNTGGYSQQPARLNLFLEFDNVMYVRPTQIGSTQLLDSATQCTDKLR